MGEGLRELMCEDHKHIGRVLKSCLDLLELDVSESHKTFVKFKWLLEKHMFLEEKVIFIFSEKISDKIISDIFTLLQNHGELLQKVKEIEENYSRGVENLLKNLSEQLTEHILLEDGSFYPKLEDYLSFEQKEDISKKIKERIQE